MMPKSEDARDNIPRHVAIIMDGNGRWAKKRHLPRKMGHRAGGEAIQHVLKAAKKRGVEVVSVFAFSSENWNRPKEEVDELMRLFLNGLTKDVKKFHKNNVKLHFIGDLSRFSKEIQQGMKDATDLTKDNEGLTFVIALNYGGQWDILNATREIAQKVKEGEISPNQITQALFEKYLTLADLPYPDLFIRTSGEERISNFFLWQIAYSELYFTEVHWPDFNEKIFDKAIDVFQNRERRFGKTSEQLEEKNA